MYRKILDRDIDFMTASRLKSWRKTTGTNTVEMDTVRNTFKSINYSDIPATDHDAQVRLYLRKTTFNNKNHKIYPNQATRSDWAHRLNCWSCETYKGQFHIETLDHAINSCPCLENIQKNTLGLFGLLSNAPQQTTPTHSFLWGHFYRSSTCDSQCNFLGNLFNNFVTTEILKLRNKKGLTFKLLAEVSLKRIEQF